MPTTAERVYDLLRRIQQTPGLDPLKRLFWTELNYDRANAPVSMRGWPDAAAEALAEAPVRLAEYAGFHIIYCRLTEDRLLITPQRPVITRLLQDYPHALYIFSDADQTHWHLVNVKYDPKVRTRRLFRRITLGPLERLRTAAERIAMLDLTTLSPDLSGLSALAIQARHDEAFDVEAVTRAFFRTYREVFEFAEQEIAGIDDDETCRMFTQRLFNRLMFIVFLERKGWMEFNGEQAEYLCALWEDHQKVGQGSFYNERLKTLFFAGLNQNTSVVIPEIGKTPYLNGGLFEKAGDGTDDDPNIAVPDPVFERAFDDLFYSYNFTVTESTPLDVEVAVDPEMLGKIFEELVTGRHESGSYYTPKPVVSFMGRESLKGYLQTACPRESAEAIARFVDEHDPDGVHDPEKVLIALQRVTICDPACGSGAYLLGMMRELFDLRLALFRARGLDPVTAYDRKLEIIRRNLYGVDLDPFAVNIARLRLWLSLIVEFEGDAPPPLPNLDFKIEAGDSVLGPDPSGGLQPGFQSHLIDEFVRLKGEYMREADPGVKANLRDRIEDVHGQIAQWAGGESDGGFKWALEFAEVFVDGGFDVVITNPPYVRQELIREIKPALKKVYDDLYSGTADLYVFFYYRARQLLKQAGMVCFISSNKWMRAGYGKKLRQHLAETTALQTIVDFGDLPVFNATAYPCIVIVRKVEAAPDDHAFKALNVDEIEAVERIREEVTAEAWTQPQASLRDDGWALVQPKVLALMAKLRESGTPLEEVVDGKLYRGVLTGRNEAFVIDKTTRARLIKANPRSAEVIKPWLRGRDIDRWRVKDSGQFLIGIQNSGDADAKNPWGNAKIEEEARRIFKETYPAIEAHLSKYEDVLRPRHDQGRFWWELRACAYYSHLEEVKIIWPDIANQCEFTLDQKKSLR